MSATRMLAPAPTARRGRPAEAAAGQAGAVGHLPAPQPVAAFDFGALEVHAPSGTLPLISLQRCGGHACPEEGCEAHHLQRSAAATEAPAAGAPGLVRAVLSSPGKSLDEVTRSTMERRLGHDFAGVRIHDGPRASESAYGVGALAYTAGNHIVFAGGQYAPGTEAGRSLLAHELTHVVQQRRGPVAGTPIGGGLQVSHPNDRFEREAAASARRLSPPAPGLSRPPAPASAAAGGGSQLQRVPAAVVVGGVAVVAGGAYLLWANHCLSPLFPTMKSETFDRFLPAYHRDMGHPIANRVWDAFGHCWIGCAGTKKCGATATAIMGKTREFYREYIGGGPHDSYDQDTNNQTTGRGFGSQGLDCYTACDAAARSGRLDLSAPEGTCYDGVDEYPAPCTPGGPARGAPATPTRTTPPPPPPPPSPPPGGPQDAGAGPRDAGLPGGLPNS